MEDEVALFQYRTNQIQTASTDRLVLLLYEGGLKAAQDCQQAIQTNDWTTMGEHGRHLQEIMIGLTDILQVATDEAQTLRDLYLYCWKQAVSAQVRRESTELDGCIAVLQNLIDGLRRFLSTEPPNASVPEPAPETRGASQPSVNLAG